MIPKVIHYCWFGGNPLPKSAQKCIASWRKYLPDYEIKEWNESNFDVNIIPYTAEAYKAKKYAFVSDYARFWILYKYGGLYFDTDVEVIKNMDDIIAKGPFMGCENEAKAGASSEQLGVTSGLGLGVNPGLGLGVNPGLGLYWEILDIYKDKHYILPDGTYSRETVVTITTDLLCKYGLKNISDIQVVAGVLIYPKEYFCPKDYKTGILELSERTVSIHHYDASWHSEWEKIEEQFWTAMGIKNQYVFNKAFNCFKRIKTRICK